MDTQEDKQTEIELDLNEHQYERIQPIIDEVLDKYGNDRMYIYLYKADPKKKGGYSQVDKFQTFILPDSHDIGTMYGGGSYYIWIVYYDESGTKKNIKRSFTLNESYDRLAAKTEMEERAGLKTISGNNDGTMLEMLKMIQDESRRNTEMLIEAIKSKPESSLADKMAAFAPFVPVAVQFVKNMGGGKGNDNSDLIQLLIKQSIDNANTKTKELTDIFHKGIEVGGLALPAEEESKIDTDLIKELVPLATMFLHRTQKPIAKMAVKRNPDKVERLSTPENYKLLVSELLRKHGIEKTQQILHESGFNKPELNPPELKKPIETKEVNIDPPVLETVPDQIAI
jgi:hypothetical protein